MTHTLKQWETYLSKQTPRIRLLSELGLNYEDMLEIAQLIKAENVRRPNVRRTTAYLVDNFPCTFVSFLAAFAAQNTEREFWDALGRLLEVSGGELNNSNWRKHFMEILKKNKKPTFEDVGGISNKYVTSMRIHGGIPSYSLRDFFANMLLPSIEKSEYKELQGKELLDSLLDRSAVLYFTDSTVRNFFDNSGEIGVDFLESSRHVARTYRSSRQVPTDHSLPSYVVQRLINFLENQEDEATGLRRPKIRFDAEGNGLFVELPEEPLTADTVRGNQACWQIFQSQELLQQLPVRIVRGGRDVHTQKVAIPLGYLTEPFQITLSIPNQDSSFHTIREWPFELGSTDIPELLVFRSEDASLLRLSQTLPAHSLLLVYRKEIHLEFEGDARVIYSPEIYADGWDNWKAEYISLENAFSVSLIKNDVVISTIPIQKQLEWPRLVGRLFSPNRDHKPLYVGTPPRLHIPLRQGAVFENELKRWYVELNSAWEAEPACRIDFKLSDKSEWVMREDDAIEFDLAAILGREPKGTYTIRVRGPLETDVEIPFRVWPLVYVKDLPEFILPTQEQKTVLHITVPSHASVETQAGVTGVDISGRYGQFVVELEESQSHLDLNLVWQKDASIVHVPLTLPVPYIKWRLVLGDEAKIEWQNRAIHKPLEALLQSDQTPALLITMPGIEMRTKQLVLQLIDPEKPEEVLQDFKVLPSVLGSDHIRVLLNASDTVKHHVESSVFEFRLSIAHPNGKYESITLLTLNRNINVSNVRLEETEEGLYLLWKEPVPLRNRRVFIRSMWKTWVDAWNIKIPDDARGKLDLLSAGYGLPPSWYEVHFYVAPSWQEDLKSAPDHDTYVVKTISPEDQINWLKESLEKHPENSFINYFERACLYATIGEISKRDQEIFNCYTHIGQAKLAHLLAFHDWVGKYDPSTKRAVQMKMYNPEYLTALYRTFKRGNEFRQNYQKYILGTHIKPESALLLIENENDPATVFHALRELIKRRNENVLDVISLMLEESRLSDADAIEFLKLEEEFYLSKLNSGQPTEMSLRLLSGLLQSKNELVNSLSNERILALAKVNKDPKLIKHYLGLLIQRGDQKGMAFTMELFESGQLLGNEVTDLLGENPKFSIRALAEAPQVHAYSIQISELMRIYPLESGYVTTGMYVKTPVGWGEIEAIVSSNGNKLKIVPIEERQVKYHVSLSAGTYHLPAIIDVQNEKLLMVNSGTFYQCNYCGLLSHDSNFIVRQHNQEFHAGSSPSYKFLPSSLPYHGDLQFK